MDIARLPWLATQIFFSLLYIPNPHVLPMDSSTWRDYSTYTQSHNNDDGDSRYPITCMKFANVAVFICTYIVIMIKILSMHKSYCVYIIADYKKKLCVYTCTCSNQIGEKGVFNYPREVHKSQDNDMPFWHYYYVDYNII